MRSSDVRALLLVLVLAGGGCTSAGRQPPSPFFWQWGKPLDELVTQALSADPDHRREAALALGRKRLEGEDLRNVAELLAALLRSDPVPLVRSAGAVSLGRLGGPERVEALALGLSDSSPMVRADVCGALGASGAVEAIGPLGERLKQDPDVDVRCASARALGGFEEPEARRGLLEGLEDSRAAVRAAACGGLRRSTGARSVPPDRAAWEAWLAGEREEGPRKRFLFW